MAERVVSLMVRGVLYRNLLTVISAKAGVYLFINRMDPRKSVMWLRG